MLDALGVNQHHDAATGTGRQHVADDYAWMLFKAMQSNNILYTKLIEEEALAFAIVEEG